MYIDLLVQARQLAFIDSTRPKQANLRRAVSAAYYALFHFLVQESCRNQIGSQHYQAPYRHVLGRAFSHGVMKQACNAFGARSLKSTIQNGLPTGFLIPLETQVIARSFVELQYARHAADYDLTRRWVRLDVVTMIEDAKLSIEAFQGQLVTDEKRFFLACLWAWKDLANR